MSTAIMNPRSGLDSTAERALRAVASFWFVVAVIGQWVFMFYLVAFYGPSTFTGNFQNWSKATIHARGYIPGDTAGNLAFASHALLASVIAFGGAIQLIPQIRARAIGFHRWLGRVFMVTALGLSASGLYMTWIRGARVNMTSAIAVTINAMLIITFVCLAWRAAVAHRISTHRRWALRTYLVANAQWFTRVGIFAWIAINRGPVGIGDNFDGPFSLFWAFGCYLLPLAVLELYLRAKNHPGVLRHTATAGVLFALTLAMGVGIFAVSTAAWLPSVKAAYDPRKSIAFTLSATIASDGIEQAEKQFRELRLPAAANIYYLDERELNTLGYQLLRAKKLKEAIRIFQLNVEAFPQSSNTYDSLGEGYMNDGNTPLAIANYQRSLELNPKNRNAVEMLRRLNAS